MFVAVLVHIVGKVRNHREVGCVTLHIEANDADVTNHVAFGVVDAFEELEHSNTFAVFQTEECDLVRAFDDKVRIREVRQVKQFERSDRCRERQHLNLLSPLERYACRYRSGKQGFPQSWAVAQVNTARKILEVSCVKGLKRRSGHKHQSSDVG